MQSQSSYKTPRNNTPNRGRTTLLKQTSTKSFNDEYQYGTLKAIAKPSLNINPSTSPMRKIIVTPSTTKNSSEYFQRPKENSVPRSSYRGAAIRSSQIQLNINEDKGNANDVVNFDELAKSSSSSKLKMKNVKKSTGFNTNYNFETLRTDEKIKTDGPESARTPKTVKAKQSIEFTVKNSTPKAGEYYSARGAVSSRDKVTTEPDLAKRKEPESAKRKEPTSAKKRDSDLQTESRTTAAVSSNPRASALQDSKWDSLKLPVTPDYVLQNFGSYLSPYEKQEITEYPEIYYISDIYHKILARGSEEFDDERQDYLVVKNDHIRYRYEALEMMGKGSFGQVLKVFDHKKKEYAALKVIRSPKKFHFQAKIEIKILKYMMDNNGADYNIIGVRDYFTFRNHACVVFDLMDSNLYDLLKKNKFRGFPASTVRKFAIQVLYALKFLRHHRLIHCDLKPENILLKQANRTGIKMIDFGSSCFEHEKLYTYIQSRFYRSPEVIMGLPYSTQIDMWSFGCLLCELYLGNPVFAGDSERDQLLSMFEVLGVPDRNLINSCPRKAKFFDEHLAPLTVPNTKGKIRVPNSNPIASLVKAEDNKLLDLIRHCLEFDPKKRFTPDEALAHEWIVEGLPPQLQSQHLKFIRDTSSPAETQSSSQYSILNSKRNNTQQDIYASIKTEESTNQTSQNILKRHASIEKAAGNLSARVVTNTYDDKEEKSVDMNDSGVSQQRFATKKVSTSQKEKLSLKAISRIAGDEPKSANYGSGSYSSDRNEMSASMRRGLSMQQVVKSSKPNSEFFNTSTNKIPGDDSATKGNIVAWDNVNKRIYTGPDTRAMKNSFEVNKMKKGEGYSHYYSPKAPHSVERVSQKTEKEASPAKNYLLPSLKASTSMKRLNY